MEESIISYYERDLIINRLLNSKRDTRFTLNAYEFILLIFSVLEKAGRTTNFSAKEIVDTTSKTATILYGAIAEFVLADMGIRTAEDIGAIISNLIDLDILKEDDNDSISEFYYLSQKSLFAKKKPKPLNIQNLKVFEDT